MENVKKVIFVLFFMKRRFKKLKKNRFVNFMFKETAQKKTVLSYMRRRV
jgi:hypothetical protein